MTNSKVIVVFCHGYLGFVDISGIEYFRGIQKHLSRCFPDIQFLFPRVSSLGTIRERAAQLRDQIEKSTTGQSAIHLMGHSMGGLDARFLVSPDGLSLGNVKTLTTVGTPHHGSPVADLFYSRLRFLGAPFLVGEGLKDLCTADMHLFNREIRNSVKTRYISYAGLVDQSGAPSILHASYRIVQEREGDNDGLVSVRSAKWGEFQEILKASHIAQIGWGMPIEAGRFCHKEFYSSLVRRFVLS